MTQNNAPHGNQAKNINVPLPRGKGAGLVQVGQLGCALAGGDIVWVSPDGCDHTINFPPSKSPLSEGCAVRVSGSQPSITQVSPSASGEYPYSTSNALATMPVMDPHPRIIIVG